MKKRCASTPSPKANPAPGDGCYQTCELEDCGDGGLEPEEACDDGVNDGSYGSCLSDCGACAPYCGDGQLDTLCEECDDGAADTGAYGG